MKTSMHAGNTPRSVLFFCVFVSFFAEYGRTQEPWPAETWTAAENLTHLDSDFNQDLSGAYWNFQSRSLWVCQNGMAKVWELVEDGAGSFRVNEDGLGNRHEWDLGTQDLEDLTQIDPDQNIITVIDESAGVIQSFDLSDPLAAVLVREWNVSAHLPAYSGGMGPEGICFVPDEWLMCRQFRDQTGNRYQSQKGMNGVVLIAHQQQGQVYAFDLNPDASHDFLFVGHYDSSRDESCGIGFEHNLGLLYIWHNTGSNYLELTDLTSMDLGSGIRRFRTVREFFGPATGNLEGFAAAPQIDPGQESWCFITRDDGGSDSLRWFKTYALPDVDPPDFSGMTPRIESVGAAEFTVAVSLDEAGVVYYVLLPDGGEVPDYMHVRGERNAAGGDPLQSGSIPVPVAGTESTAVVTGLTAGTSYDVHLVGEDESAILQTSVQSLEVTTLEATPSHTPTATPTGTPTETPTFSPSGTPTETPTTTPVEATPTPQPIPASTAGGIAVLLLMVTGIIALGFNKLR